MNAKAFGHQMGLRRLQEGTWLELHHPALAAQLAKKAELMAKHANDLLVTLPGFEVSSLELQTTIAAEHRLQGKREPEFDDSIHPLDGAARVVREDLCVHEVIDDTLVLVAGSVCFPTRWTLSEKIGQPISVIHHPVPGLADDIGPRIDQFVTRLRPGAGSWRTNWSLLSTDELSLPGYHRDLPVVEHPQELFYRNERQTLRRLPATGAVVFTIGIDVQPLSTFAQNRPEALAFADLLESLPAPFLAYKGLTSGRDDIVSYLRSL